MTILGAAASHDGAIIWADSREFDRDGEELGHVAKVTVNTLAGCAGVGGGKAALVTAAASALLGQADFDEAVDAVKHALRRAAPKVAAQCALREPYGFCANVYVLVGWSTLYRRFLAYELDARAFFEPRLVGRVMRPVPAGGCGPALPSLAEVARLAASQATEFGRAVGALTVVSLGHHGMVVHPPQEIAPPPRQVRIPT